MTITVVIPTYNYSMFLANAIDSVLSQTRQADRIVIVDDASQDQYLSRYIASQYDIEFIGRDKNMGHHQNFQDILENVINTETAMFLTADNYLGQEFLRFTDELYNTGIDIVGTETFIVGEYADLMYKERGGDWQDNKSDMKVWKWAKSNIMMNCWLHGSSLFNVEKARESGGFVNDLSNGPDWSLWRTMIENGATFDKVDKPLLFYRQHRFNYYQHTYETARGRLKRK